MTTSLLHVPGLRRDHAGDHVLGVAAHGDDHRVLQRRARTITGFQNGWAVAGDYMSAASFLGIAGLIAFYGYDGFMYSVGWLVAYLTVLLLVAEPLRNTGRFTMADVLAFRLRRPVVRVVAAISTLTVSLFYMIAQMVGAGSLVSLLVPGIGFNTAIVGVGVAHARLRHLRRHAGDDLGADRQGGPADERHDPAVDSRARPIRLLDLRVLRRGVGVTGSFCRKASRGKACARRLGAIVRDFTQPGLHYNGRWGALSI